MLSRIFSEALRSVSDKHSHETATKSPPASLLHYIENNFNHSSGKCHDSMTMAALSFTKSTGSLYNIYLLISPFYPFAHCLSQFSERVPEIFTAL